jgi:hypothetical protein
MIYQGKSWPIFTGSVIEAVPAADWVTVQAVGAQQLHEQIVPDMVYSGVTTPELIYVLARSSGIRQERLNIEGVEFISADQGLPIADAGVVALTRILQSAVFGNGGGEGLRRTIAGAVSGVVAVAAVASHEHAYAWSGLGNGPIGVGVGAWLAVALVGLYELLMVTSSC